MDKGTLPPSSNVFTSKAVNHDRPGAAREQIDKLIRGDIHIGYLPIPHLILAFEVDRLDDQLETTFRSLRPHQVPPLLETHRGTQERLATATREVCHSKSLGITTQVWLGGKDPTRRRPKGRSTKAGPSSAGD